MKKKKVKMNTTLYLGFLILEIGKSIKNEFWYDYIKPKYQNIAKLYYVDFMIFVEILLMKLKNGLTHHTIVETIRDHFQIV